MEVTIEPTGRESRSVRGHTQYEYRVTVRTGRTAPPPPPETVWLSGGDEEARQYVNMRANAIERHLRSAAAAAARRITVTR